MREADDSNVTVVGKHVDGAVEVDPQHACAVSQVDRVVIESGGLMPHARSSDPAHSAVRVEYPGGGLPALTCDKHVVVAQISGRGSRLAHDRSREIARVVKGSSPDGNRSLLRGAINEEASQRDGVAVVRVKAEDWQPDLAGVRIQLPLPFEVVPRV